MPVSRVRKPRKVVKGRKPSQFKSLKTAKRYAQRNMLHILINHRGDKVLTRSLTNALTFKGRTA